MKSHAHAHPAAPAVAHPLRLAAACLTLAFAAAPPGLSSGPGAALAQDNPAPLVVPAELTPAIDLKDVRIGMKGYGLSVFAGDQVEPFPFEVQAVVPTSSPQRAVVWVRCTSERMLRYGPVQGMSGSPMYVWTDGEPEVLGQGGKLLGAFAYGFADTNECVAGVQPIAYMRETGARMQDEPASASTAGAPAHPTPGRDARLARGMAAGYVQAAADWGPRERFPALASATLLDRWSAHASTPRLTELDLAALEAWAARASHAAGGDATPPPADAAMTPLALPMSAGSPQTAALLGPVLAPAGLAPYASGGLLAGTPAPSIDPNTPIEAGSVLAIPLVVGDVDLGAYGTVTEVLPDGSVLGLGHSMFGRGDIDMPLATGYVHFVVSRRTNSFKLAGSLKVVGRLLRDEQFGVAGVPDPEPNLPYAPVTVEVDLPDRDAETFEFHVFADPVLGASLLAAAVAESLNAVIEPGELHTVGVEAKLTFAGGRTIRTQTEVVSSGAGEAVGAVAPYAQIVAFNPIETAPLTGAEIRLTVQEKLDAVQILGGRLSRDQALPGETVELAIDLKPADGPIRTVQVPIEIPEDTPPGPYPVVVADPASYMMLQLASDPSLEHVRSLDDIVRQVNALASIDARQLHVLTQRSQDQGLAVAGRLLPGLPGSKAALLADAPRTDIAPAPSFQSRTLPADGVVQGAFSMLLVVPDPEEESE